MPKSFLESLLQHDKYILSTHVKPDGDALGSQLALGRFLQSMGKEVALINSDTSPGNLEWLPGIRQIRLFDGSLEIRQKINSSDAVVVLDANAFDRLGPVGKTLKNSGKVSYLIDHHTLPDTDFTAAWSDENASSTGELVFDLIHQHTPDLLDYDVCVCLYVAIITDTGSLRYSNVTAELHRKVADIVEIGNLDVAAIQDKVFTRSMAGLKLLGKTLVNLTLVHGGRVGYIVLEQQTLRDLGADRDDTEGLVNYPLSIDGVDVSLFFYETDRGTKVSFRSTGDTAVDKIARTFGGGGHRNASGCFIKHPLEIVIKKILAALPKYVNLGDDGEPDVSDAEVEEMTKLFGEKSNEGK